mmetsp:Transcript_15849/g.55144  ORF Transcript_15849/g.55144 Transcript_15849/m.55144 type:complete len:335 (-) Transcript_15849:148-1152(-)
MPVSSMGWMMATHSTRPAAAMPGAHASASTRPASSASADEAAEAAPASSTPLEAAPGDDASTAPALSEPALLPSSYSAAALPSVSVTPWPSSSSSPRPLAKPGAPPLPLDVAGGVAVPELTSCGSEFASTSSSPAFDVVGRWAPTSGRGGTLRGSPAAPHPREPSTTGSSSRAPSVGNTPVTALASPPAGLAPTAPSTRMLPPSTACAPGGSASEDQYAMYATCASSTPPSTSHHRLYDRDDREVGVVVVPLSPALRCGGTRPAMAAARAPAAGGRSLQCCRNASPWRALARPPSAFNARWVGCCAGARSKHRLGRAVRRSGCGRRALAGRCST